jgi:hypothetical protein
MGLTSPCSATQRESAATGYIQMPGGGQYIPGIKWLMLHTKGWFVNQGFNFKKRFVLTLN